MPEQIPGHDLWKLDNGPYEDSPADRHDRFFEDDYGEPEPMEPMCERGSCSDCPDAGTRFCPANEERE